VVNYDTRGLHLTAVQNYTAQFTCLWSIW